MTVQGPAGVSYQWDGYHFHRDFYYSDKWDIREITAALRSADILPEEWNAPDRKLLTMALSPESRFTFTRHDDGTITATRGRPSKIRDLPDEPEHTPRPHWWTRTKEIRA